MRNDTQSKILQYIHNHTGARADEIIRYFKLNSTGIFRHLKKLREQNKIYALGKPPKVNYYAYVSSMEFNSPALTNATNWSISGDSTLAPADLYCSTQDIFQARTNRLLSDLKKNGLSADLVYLIVAAVGEIGNNSFDHNLGKWRDLPGVLFNSLLTERKIILADRGQGVFQSIKNVRPEIGSDIKALQVAFTEMVSGRAPEQRGNGLKFVKKVVEENRLRLIFYSGEAVAEITSSGLNIKKSSILIPGTLAYIEF